MDGGDDGDDNDDAGNDGDDEIANEVVKSMLTCLASPLSPDQFPPLRVNSAMQLNFELQHFPVRQLPGPDRSGNFPDRIDLKHNLSRSDGQTSCLLSDRP